jgi:hypothetical protein
VPLFRCPPTGIGLSSDTSAKLGQDPYKGNCEACDLCLPEVMGVPDSLVVAPKILSGLISQGERFGADYTAGVLIDCQEERIPNNWRIRSTSRGLGNTTIFEIRGAFFAVFLGVQ